MNLNFRKPEIARRRTRLKSQSGLAMLEYALILGTLIIAFVIFGIMLQKTSIFRGQRAAESVNRMVPCYRDVKPSDKDHDIVDPKITSGDVLGYKGNVVDEECM